MFFYTTAFLHLYFTAFTPEQLVYAVQLATQFAIWMGFLSLVIEILGAFIRYELGAIIKLFKQQ